MLFYLFLFDLWLFGFQSDILWCKLARQLCTSETIVSCFDCLYGQNKSQKVLLINVHCDFQHVCFIWFVAPWVSWDILSCKMTTKLRIYKFDSLLVKRLSNGCGLWFWTYFLIAWFLRSTTFCFLSDIIWFKQLDYCVHFSHQGYWMDRQGLYRPTDRRANCTLACSTK